MPREIPQPTWACSHGRTGVPRAHTCKVGQVCPRDARSTCLGTILHIVYTLILLANPVPSVNRVKHIALRTPARHDWCKAPVWARAKPCAYVKALSGQAGQLLQLIEPHATAYNNPTAVLPPPPMQHCIHRRFELCTVILGAKPPLDQLISMMS